MVFNDLRSYLRALEAEGELIRVNEPISVELELPALLRGLMYRGGPAVMIERTRENTLPAVGNLFGKWSRVLTALNGVEPGKAAERISELTSLRPPTGIIDALKSLGELRSISRYFPRLINKAPVKENEWGNIDLFRLPAIRQWPKEPGRFLTFAVSFIKHGDVTNFGYYRLQIIGKDKFIMHWMPWRRSSQYADAGETEVAVVLGPDPVTMLMAGVPVPHPLDKVLVTGVIRGEGIELTSGSTISVEYPANAEIVIEGKLTGEYVKEGPFGDHVGYYSIVKEYPVVKVTAVYSRENPVVPVTVTGKPVLEDGNIIRFGTEVMKPLLRQLLPEVVDVYMPPEGVGYWTVVSIRKRYPGQARRIMAALWGLLPVFNKIVVVVDHDIDVKNMKEVTYAIAANLNPQRDVVVMPEYPTEELDPSTPIPGLGSKLGLDATRKLPGEYNGEEYPEEAQAPSEVEKAIAQIINRILANYPKHDDE
ncbi:MAG: UbiD family decarboxylase [Caldivirga sp.]|uniref:UbiD family decarboxylase n=1 Tax=Caldivirga sp. TaxID=2080243 RepID=UPI003D0A7F18